MKKFQWIGLISIVLLWATSCQNESRIDSIESAGNQITLSASRSMSSRTHLGDDGEQTVWSEGDQIWVSSIDGEVTGVLTLDKNDVGKSTGTFTGFVSGNPDFLKYSVYPVPSNGCIDLSELVGADKLDAPMIGPVENKNVQFVNTCGILRVNLQNAENVDLTVKAKVGTKQVALCTTAEVIINDDDVAELKYSSSPSSNGTVSVKGAKGDYMYIPYYINEDVDFYVDDIRIVSASSNDFIGKILQKDVKMLAYSETAKKVIEPLEVKINETDIQQGDAGGKVLTIDVTSLNVNPGSAAEPYEFVQVPSISDVLENTSMEVDDIVVILPKVDSSSSKTSIVSFTEVPQNATITIKEESGDTSSDKESVEKLSVILPSNILKEEVSDNVIIYMPNSSVTVKSSDGELLQISRMEATTADETLIIEKEVEVDLLIVSQGTVIVYGYVTRIQPNDYTQLTRLIIKEGGAVPYGYQYFDYTDENQSSETEMNGSHSNIDVTIGGWEKGE